jgi:predicted metal-binding membrane protein
MFRPQLTDSRPFIIVFVALIAIAWLTLFAWGQSPYSRYLNHDAIGEITVSANSIPAILLFAGGWTLMTIAMMLPTALPLVVLFRNLVRARPQRTKFVALLIAGYLAIWGMFGVAVHLFDRLIHAAVDYSALLSTHAWILGAVTLLIAGVYQFTPLKYLCLDKCRSPMNFIMSRWSGKREPLQSFRIGIDHGIFCVGCCWSLMLLMFVVGIGNIGWMFMLAAIMAIEKNVRWGKRLSTPLGIVLIAAGLLTVAQATIL